MFYCDQICKVNLAFIHRHMSLEFLMGGLVHSFYKYRIIRTKYQYCSLRMTRCLVHTWVADLTMTKTLLIKRNFVNWNGLRCQVWLKSCQGGYRLCLASLSPAIPVRMSPFSRGWARTETESLGPEKIPLVSSLVLRMDQRSLFIMKVRNLQPGAFCGTQRAGARVVQLLALEPFLVLVQRRRCPLDRVTIEHRFEWLWQGTGP